MSAPATLLAVPGLRGHVPQHWQTLLVAGLPGARAVPPLAENGLSLAARVAALEAAVQAIDGPLILVAHSAGVPIVVHWSALHPQSASRVTGALLAAPPDLEAARWPEAYPQPHELRGHGWMPLPATPLPFPSILAASSDDYLCELEAARRMAAGWGSELVELGPVGHLNPAAGFGPWPGAQELVARLRARAVAE